MIPITMFQSYKIVIFALILLFATACKKEPTNWNTDWSAPLIHGHLTINDIVPVDYTTTNGDGYLSFVYHESVYSFSLDTLLAVPDTTVINTYAIGLPSFNFNPGATLPSTLDQSYNMGDIELKRVIVESGTGIITMRNTWQGQTYIGFNFPAVFENGSTFSRDYILPPGTITNPSEVVENVDMKDFDMYLTGSDGSFVNTLYADFNMGSAETTNIITVTSSDTLYYLITFQDVIPKYAKGYFGQHHLVDTVGFSFAPMKKIIGGTIDIDSIDMTLTVKNGFKLISQTKITKLTGINTRTSTAVDLNFPQFNTSININPATGGYYDWAPSTLPIIINNSNSSILGFIENLPDSIVLGYEVDINPYGNVSAGGDEFFPGSTMELFLDAEFPAQFSANDLTIVDTMNISYKPGTEARPQNGNLVLSYVNAFPVDATAIIHLLDGNDVELDQITGNSGIVSGSYNTVSYLTVPYSGSVTFQLSSAQVSNLELAEKMVLEVHFNSDADQTVKIDANAYFDFNLRSNIAIQISF